MTIQSIPLAEAERRSKFANGGSKPAPIPLFPPLRKGSPYPLEALGELAPAAQAIANKVQVPTSIAGQSVLCAAALAAQALADVVLPYGQTRPLSLFGLSMAGSGERKTSSDKEAMRPIRLRESKLREIYEDRIASYRIESAAWFAQKKKIEADRSLETVQDRVAELTALGPEPTPPLLPILTVPDPTYEGLSKAWSSAPGSLGLFSSEGGQLTGGHGFSPEHRLATAGGYSGLWDGTGIRRLRAGDGLIDLRGRRLSAHLMIQPGAAAAFLSDPILRDQGLLSRLLIAAPESLSGARLYCEPTEEDEKAIRRYTAQVCGLLEADWPCGATPNELEPRKLPLSAASRQVWIKFHNETEKALVANGSLRAITDVAAKASEQAARVAGVLTIVADKNAAEIDPREMVCACKLVTWHLNEASRLAEASLLDPSLKKAEALLDWLSAHCKPKITLRDVCNAGPSQTRQKAEATRALKILEDHGWISLTGSRPTWIELAEAEI